MKIYYKSDDCTLYQGKMQDVLDTLPENSIDSCVCDPPYCLTDLKNRWSQAKTLGVSNGTQYGRLVKGFMGKAWDDDVAMQPETWAKVYRVLKRGGYLLAFGGTRTFHRIACAIEDAGFEIRDTIMWLYGSGFPKSMDISKQLDKKPNKNFESKIKFGELIKEYRNKNNLSQRQLGELIGVSRELINLYEIKGNCQQQIPTKEQWGKIKKVLNIPNNMDYIYEEAERQIIGKKESGCFNSQEKDRHTIGSSKPLEVDITLPSTDLAKQWSGWGTALKPAYEPIIVARKPVEDSVVNNVLKYGVGGINIDECRIYGDEKISCHDTEKGTFAGKTQTMPKIKGKLSFGQYEEKAERIEYHQHEGRFPSNVILDGSEEVCAGMPEGAKTGHRSQTSIQNCIQARKDKKGNSQCDIGGDIDHITEYTDEGSASRYFMNCKYTRKDDEIWKQLLVNNVENNLEILKAIKENIVQMNVEELLKELKNHYAKYVDSQLKQIEISIVQDIVEILTWDFKIETSQVIQDFITNYSKCIQFLNLVQFVEKMDNIDTTQTTQNLLKLFGYVKVVITNYIQGNLKCEQNRYIYTPKASKKDRDNGLDMFEEMQTTDGCIRSNSETTRKFGANSALRKNTHPTVKPVELMQYLVRLVSPKGATILDCFMGSGSTGKAVMFENRERNANYKFIGIEMTEEYLPIAKARIEYARDTFKYDIEKIKKDTGQLNIFDFMEEINDNKKNN